MDQPRVVGVKGGAWASEGPLNLTNRTVDGGLGKRVEMPLPGSTKARFPASCHPVCLFWEAFSEFEFAMKSLLAAALLSFASLAGAASAATVDAVQMKQNEWIVFDFAPEQGVFKVTPGSTDGSFSYSYGFSDSLCPQSWACMPQTRAFNTVYANGGGDFGYGWNPQSFGSVVSETTLTGAKNSLYLFFRVTSGSASVSQLVADQPETPAPVPLPASALLLLGGVGGLAALRRRRKAA